jgi:hypothetical protein
MVNGKVLTVLVFNSKLLQYDSKPGEAILSVIHRAKGVTGRSRLVIYNFATQKQNFWVRRRVSLPSPSVNKLAGAASQPSCGFDLATTLAQPV